MTDQEIVTLTTTRGIFSVQTPPGAYEEQRDFGGDFLGFRRADGSRLEVFRQHLIAVDIRPCVYAYSLPIVLWQDTLGWPVIGWSENSELSGTSRWVLTDREMGDSLLGISRRLDTHPYLFARQADDIVNGRWSPADDPCWDKLVSFAGLFPVAVYDLIDGEPQARWAKNIETYQGKLSTPIINYARSLYANDVEYLAAHHAR